MYKATKCNVAALFAAVTILLAMAVPATGQQMVFQSSDNEPMTMLAIPGGMVLVGGFDEARIARRIVPSSAATETPDLQEGDRIIFLNGARINSAEQLETLYEEIDVDAEVKLGIQRGEEKMIRAYNKPEPQRSYASDNGGRVMRFEVGGPGGGGDMQGLANRNLWPAGFLVGEKDGNVVIASSMPIPGKAEALSALSEGDQISRLDGADIRTVEQLLAAYEEIVVGDDVTIEYKFGNDIGKIMFKKPEPPRMRMRIQQN